MGRRNILQVMAWFGLAFGGGTVVLGASSSCYDSHSPNLPPCDPKQPDPQAGCYDRRVNDAGKDGSDAR